VTAADAKKFNYPIFAAPKHVVKGNATTIDLGGHPKEAAAANPKLAVGVTGVKGLKPPTAVKGSVKPSPRSPKSA